MYKIAVCDDEQTTCKELEKIIDKCNSSQAEQFTLTIFMEGEDLIEKLQGGERFDFLFLDINLTTINGIDVGKYIREELEDYKTLIVYISSYESYAMSLFQVHPFEFLIKPLKDEVVCKVLQRGIRCYKNSQCFLEYSKNKSIYSINCADILYICSDRKKIIIIRVDNEQDEFYGKLKDILPRLPDNFSMINQSYIINRNYVQKYSYEEVIMMNKQTLLISRAYRKAIREIAQKQRRKD